MKAGNVSWISSSRNATHRSTAMALTFYNTGASSDPSNSLVRGLARRGVGAAGMSFLQQNFDPRFPTLSADAATNYDNAAQSAAKSFGAPYGSIAARANPFQYGSIASRQFGDLFGRDTGNAFDNANTNVDSRTQGLGMLRRQLYSNFGYGGNDGSGY